MTKPTFRTLDGGNAELDAPTRDAFAAAVRGGVVLPGEPGYEQARTVWNAMVDHRPALIAAARTARTSSPRSGSHENIACDVLVDDAAGLSPLSAVLFFQMHGAATRVAPGATAFAARRDQWDIDILTQWTDPAHSDAHVAWTRTFWNALVPFSEGVYVNHLDGDEAVARVRSAYGTNYDRLAAIKARYDPDNLFRHNNNIPPA